jgi:hypothetical protein
MAAYSPPRSISSWWVPISVMRPPSKTKMWSQATTLARRWEISTVI